MKCSSFQKGVTSTTPRAFHIPRYSKLEGLSHLVTFTRVKCLQTRLELTQVEPL